jgi:hypothetical protein
MTPASGETMGKKAAKNALDPIPGRVALFRNKVRKPVSITLTKDHHRKTRLAERRLALTRSDVIGLLIDRYAEVVQLTDEERERMIRATDDEK